MSFERGLREEGYSIAQLRRLAQRRLPRPIFDFADGAAQPDPSIELFGRRLPLPILIGPTDLGARSRG